MLTVFVSERPFMVHLLTTKRYIVYLTFDRFLSFLLQREMTFYNSILAPLFFLLDSKQIGCKSPCRREKDQSNNCVLLTINWSSRYSEHPHGPRPPSPTIHLNQIFEISSLKNLVRRNGIFCLIPTRFLQATQAVKIQFEINKKFRFVKLNFSNQRFQNSSGDEQGDR